MTRQLFRQYLIFAIFFSLFQKSPAQEGGADTIQQADDEEPDQGRIRCPLCRWRPDAGSFWACNDNAYPERFFGGCGMTWNTFDTRGLCPGCGHQWRWTGCLSCHGWSLHEDWYAKDGE